MIDGPKSDAEWRAEQDAETIAEAKMIMADKDRLAKAQVAAEKKAKEWKERAAKMDSVADSKGFRSSPGGISTNDPMAKVAKVSRGNGASGGIMPANISLTILKKGGS